MANFDIKALSFFTQVQYDNEDTMVQKSGTGTKSAGLWDKNDLTRWHRSEPEKAANNAIRAQLLESLGAAFGLQDGITYDKDHNAVFSKAFMDQLEHLLGKDFKRSNFGVGKNGGTVSSGKPLTQRRITAILNKAQQVANAPQGVSVGSSKPVASKSKVKIGERVPFSVDAYRDKADAIIKAKGTSSGVREAMIEVRKVLDFLKNELPNLIKENPDYDPEFGDEPIFTEKYYIEVPRKDASPWQQKKATVEGNGKMLTDYDSEVLRCKVTKDDVRELISKKFGLTVHVENAKPGSDNDMGTAIKGYLTSVLTAFAKTAIDLYEDTLGTDKAHGAEMALMYHNPCIEGWTDGLMAFQVENKIQRSDPNEAPVNLNVADHNRQTPLVDCMYKEVGVIMAGRGEESPKWSECRKALVDRLVGLERPMEKGGKPQVIKETDIDGLKDIFLNELLGEDDEVLPQNG